MKIIINTCFGGGSFSTKGLLKVLEAKGTPGTVCVERGEHSYGIATEEELNDGEWKGLVVNISADAVNNPWGDGYVSNRLEEHRTDPDFIQLVEQDAKAASGTHAALRVVEIPDNSHFIVEEYDGIERIYYSSSPIKSKL